MAVVLFKCDSYDTKCVFEAVQTIFRTAEMEKKIQPGCTVGIKANLVAPMQPDTAAVTHPEVIRAVCRAVKQLGGTPIVGDSPGGPYSIAYLNAVYGRSGLHQIEEEGIVLNRDIGTRDVHFEQGIELRSFTCTEWLCNVDMIINISKLKTHGMVGLSCAVKNLFGTIPGTMKPEYHFRFPDQIRFGNMLIDLNEYWKPVLNICDGVVAMEENGPTKGRPRQVGVIGGSVSPYELDLVMSSIIGLTPEEVPTLQLALERKLAPSDVNEIQINGDCSLQDLRVKDFVKSGSSSDLLFSSRGKLVSKILGKLLTSVPECHKKECIGCRKCESICPAKAIIMIQKKPVIDRSKCIRCFCCQEFCPAGSMKVHRTWIARLIVRDSNN